MRIVFQKLFKVFVFGAGILARTLVVVALDIVVHRGSRGGGFIAVLIPSRLNLVRCLSVIFTFSPFFGPHHGADNGVGVEFFKVRVIPRCNGSILDGWVAVDRIGVRDRVECNPLVTWMGVYACKMVDIVGGFHFVIFCGRGRCSCS